MKQPDLRPAGARPAASAAPLVLLLAGSLLFGGCGDSTPSPSSSAPRETTKNTAAQPTEGTAPAGGESPFVMPAPPTAADEAWSTFEKGFSSPPEPPESWATNPPSEEAVRVFQRERGAQAEKLADVAKDFYTRFPADERATPARWHELQLLDAAVKLGHTNALTRLEDLEKARLADPASGEEERFAVRMASAQRSAELLIAEKGVEAAKASFEASARKMIEDFPTRSEPYRLLLNLAADGPPDQARATARSLLSTNVPEAARESAQALLDRLDLTEKPLDLKFTALDGRAVDLAALRGKVVLVDFWATWCVPCIQALPNVKAAYERLHPDGFEIVGISLDQDKEALTRFLAREKLAWPQYFDGKGWENDFARRFGITEIPTLWLVDKQGMIRDLHAGENLAEAVAKLLAETATPPAAK